MTFQTAHDVGPTLAQCHLTSCQRQTNIMFYLGLLAVKNGDLKQVTKLLSGKADMTLNFTDDDRSTVLHIGISTGSDELMKILLSRKPTIDTMNQMGQTALHVAASHGREHLAYMLLQGGADINLPNKMTGYTALHEAVSGGHKGMVDLLLCCGAETTIQTKDGLTAIDMCNEKCSMADFEASVHLLNSGRMEMKEVGLSVSHFKTVGIVSEPRQMKGPTCAVCQRRGVNNKDVLTRFASQEQVIGDEFVFRLGKRDEEYQVLITMPLSCDAISEGEEVLVKTADGNDIQPSDIWQENELLWCKFRATITHLASFVAACQPKKEQLPVNKGVSSVNSSVDPRIKFHLGKTSFNKNANLSVQVIELHEDVHLQEGAILSSTPFYVIDSDTPLSKPVDIELPEPSEYGEEQGETVVLTKEPPGSWSVRNKVVRVDQEQASVSFPVSSLPVFAVVVKSIPNYDTKSVLQEIQYTYDQVQTQFCTVCFLCVTKSLDKEMGFRVVVECCEVKSVDSRRRFWVSQGFGERQERSQIKEFKVPSNQAFTVKFYENIVFRQGCQMHSLVFHPKLVSVTQFDIIAKNDETINGRVYIYQDNNTKKHQNFEPEDDDLLTSVDISLDLRKERTTSASALEDSLDGDSYQGKHSQRGSVKGSTDSISSHETKGSVDRTAGSTPVMERSHGVKERSKSESESVAGSSSAVESNVMASVASRSKSLSASIKSKASTGSSDSVKNTTPRTTSAKSSRSGEQQSNKSISLSDDSFSSSSNTGSVVFLTNSFLDKLLNDMEEEWYKIFVLMGIPFQELDEALMKTTNPADTKKKLFREWRDTQSNRDDVGLPLLLSALFKGGCRDVANTIQIHLKRWHDKVEDKNMNLYHWLCRAYQDSNLFVPSDYPKPMSDSYLVLMADELTPSHDLGQALTLEDYEIEEIRNCNNYMYPGIKVMKMLTLFREATPSKIEALKKLIDCLEKLNYDKLRNYSVMCAKAWVKRTATRKDDPFRTQVDTLTKQL